MAELTIVFRLRFAVALAAAVCIFLAFSVARADATATRGEYIVQMDKGTSPAAGKRLVRRLGGRVTSPTLRVINGFGAALTKKAVRKLRRHRRVKAVSLNRGMEASATDVSGGYACPTTDATTVPAKAAPGGVLDPEAPILNAVTRVDQPFLKSIRADAAWARATGRGVGVAVIDTGIAGDLPDFQTPRNGSRVIASAVTNPCARDANDQYGHGTHVAGLIAGNGLVYNNGLHGKYMGVAPRANLVSVKVSDDDGNTTVLDVIYGIQFAVDNKSAYGIRVMNLSLSSTTAESYRTDPLDAAVESAWFSGIVVVTAAGNEAETSDGVTFAPANDPWVITAGALDDKGTFTRLDDVLAPWSSHGLTQDGVAKPEVLAPGARLVSTLAPGSDFADLCSSCIIGQRPLLPGGRHVDVVGGRVRCGGAPRRGASRLDARSGQGRADLEAGRRPGRGWRHRRRRRARRELDVLREPGTEHPDRPDHRSNRLGPRELPAGELPRRERLVAERHVEPGQLPLRLRIHRQRGRRSRRA